MKKFFLFLGIIITFCGIIVYGRMNQNSNAANPEAVKTVTVERGTIQSLVSTTGRVSSNLDVEIKCKASGEIIQLPYDISDSVEKGSLLLKIDPIDEERNVKQAEVNLAITKARLEQARLDLILEEKNIQIERKRLEANLKFTEAKAKEEAARASRMKELLGKKLTSQEEYDTATTSQVQAEVNFVNAKIQLEELDIRERQLDVKREEVKSNEAQVENSEIALSINKRRLEETQVYSPISGTISAKDVQIGQIISSGITNIGGGTTVMVLSDLSRIFVYADVDESDIGQVEIGQPVTITVDAFPKTIFQGNVMRIAVQGENVSNVVTFEVKIEVLDDKKDCLKPEMTANVDILTAERNDAMLLPCESVSVTGEKSTVTVVQKEGTHEKREITTGITDYDNIEIIDGLQPGDVVLLSGNEVESSWSKKEERGMFPPPPPPQ